MAPVPPLVVRSHVGRDHLRRLANEIDRIPSATPRQVGGRPCWQATWADHHRAWTPWVVTVHATDGSLRAAAGLAHRQRAGVRQVVALGHTTVDATSFPAADTTAAHRLADAIADHLAQLRADWHLQVVQGLAEDPVLDRLVQRLDAAVVPGRACPTTRFTRGRDLADYASRNYRAQARHKWNRLVRAEADPRVERARDLAAVTRWLDAITPTWRRRDAELGGRSRLDDPREAAFVRDLVLRHAAAGEIEVAVLVTDGEVAAYSVAFLDGRAYRQWNKHHDSRWGEYRPGQVLDARLLEDVLADERFEEFDWMAGDEAYKHRTATDVVETINLHAGGGPLGIALQRAPALRARVRAEMRRRPQVEEAWTEAKLRGRRLASGWARTP